MHASHLAEDNEDFRSYLFNKDIVDWKKEYRDYHSVSGRLDRLINLSLKVQNLAKQFNNSIRDKEQQKQLSKQIHDLDHPISKIDKKLSQLIGKRFLSTLDHLQLFSPVQHVECNTYKSIMKKSEINKAFREKYYFEIALEDYDGTRSFQKIKTSRGPGLAALFRNTHEHMQVITIVSWGKAGLWLQTGDRSFPLRGRDTQQLNSILVAKLYQILKGEPVDLSFFGNSECYYYLE